MELYMIRGWQFILPGWRWLMLALWNLDKTSSLWYGMGQWVELKSGNNISFF